MGPRRAGGGTASGACSPGRPGGCGCAPVTPVPRPGQARQGWIAAPWTPARQLHRPTFARWQALLDALRPGDVVLIQFGHNDQSVEKPDPYTPVDDYERYLVRFVEDVRARRGVPVLLTPVTRRRYEAGGRVADTHGAYPDRVRAVAARADVRLVDMERRSQALLQEAGDEGSKRLFLWLAPGTHANYPAGVEDGTHFSPDGAAAMARAFVAALGEAGEAAADEAARLRQLADLLR